MTNEQEQVKSYTEILAPSAVVVGPSDIQIGGRYARTLFLTTYPRYLNTGWLSPLINLDREFDVSFFIHPEDSATILKKLRDHLGKLEAEAMEVQAAGKVRDPMLETGITDVEQLRDTLQQGTERMFKVGVYVTLYGPSQKALNEAEKAIRGILEAQLIYAKPATFRMQEGHLATIPLLVDRVNADMSLNTEPLSSMFPFVSYDLTRDKGILYGINLHNNSLVIFDRFDMENANTVILGKSGGGKSIVGSEPVLVKRNGHVEMVCIGSLIEQIISEHGARKIDDELEGVINPGVEVWAFDQNLKGSWSKVTVAARKEAPSTLYRFTTKSGREVSTTGDHNLVALRNGKVVIVKSSEILENEYVPLPRYVEMPSQNQAYVNLLRILGNSKRAYVMGAAEIIGKNYEILKKNGPRHEKMRYLYKYRNGRPMPISYFLQIIEFLKTSLDDEIMDKIRLSSKLQNTVLPIEYELTAPIAKLLGYIASEGTITEKVIQISNIDSEVISDISSALKKIGAQFYYGNRGVIIADRIFVELLTALAGSEKSEHKYVAPIILDSPKELAASFIRSYFEGDGGVEHASVVAVSKSKRLVSEFCYLFYRFGIVCRILQTEKGAPGWKVKKSYWKLVISGQNNLRKFADRIGFVSKRKEELLKFLLAKKENTNVDVIPGLTPIFEEIDRLLPVGHVADLSPLKRGAYAPSPRKLREVIKKIEEILREFELSRGGFSNLNLPSLDSIIQRGVESKSLNRRLWQTLGQSWQLMKTRQVAPRVENVFRAIHAINAGFSDSVSEIKNLLHFGFQYMGLSLKHFNPSLQSALVARPISDTSYQTIWEAGKYVSAKYNERMQNIPRIRQLLAQLSILADSDLFWDPVEKIEKIENTQEKYVYDLTVDNEVFLAGNGGLFVHNSYTVKLEILRGMMFGTQVFVIDPENEYKYLADMVGGTTARISISSEDHINPFDLPKPRSDETTADVLRSHIVNLSGFFKLLLGNVTPQEDSILDEAIRQTYASRDITPESDLNNIVPPLMSDFQSVLSGMAGTESILIRIKKYTEGSFAGFLNNPTNVRLDNELVVFSIRDMEEELKPVAMYLVLNFIWTRIRTELRQRLLVVDEAWLIMRYEAGGAFLFNISKRARKYYLGLTAISQDIPDFMNSQYGKPIITNSSLQILLKQSPASMDLVQQTFHLTDAEKFFLLEAQVGHGLFFAGTSHVAIRIVASYAEDQIITSDPRQILEIEAAKRELEQ